MQFNQKKLTNQSQNSNAIGFKKLTWFCAWNCLGMTYALWNSHLWKQKTHGVLETPMFVLFI